MHAVNVLMVTRMLTAGSIGGAGGGMMVLATAEDIPFGSLWWFIYAGISCVLVLFAGIMSGLTLGLMSLGLVELEILQRSGSNAEKAQAGDE
jgi:metal transporter CNNM